MFTKNFGYSVEQCQTMIAELQSKKGRSSTFDAICGKHFADFTQMARGAGVPTDWMEDCASEGLMHIQAALCRNGFRFDRNDSDIRNWFTKVFKNFAITYQQKISKGATDELSSNIFDNLTDDADSDWKEHLLTQFNIAFAQLCADCQYLLKARYWEKRSYKNIGAELNMIENTANQNTRRCRLELKEFLKNVL